MALIITYDRGFDLTEKLESCSLDKICEVVRLRSPYIGRKKSYTNPGYRGSETLVTSQSEMGLSLKLDKEKSFSSHSVAELGHSASPVLSSRASIDSELGQFSNEFDVPSITKRRVPFEGKIEVALTRFVKRVKNATVDVWWLFDDGGTVVKYFCSQHIIISPPGSKIRHLVRT